MVLESCLAKQSWVNKEYRRSPRVEDQRGRCVVAYPYHLGAACQDVQDPVSEGGGGNNESSHQKEKKGHVLPKKRQKVRQSQSVQVWREQVDLSIGETESEGIVEQESETDGAAEGVVEAESETPTEEPCASTSSGQIRYQQPREDTGAARDEHEHVLSSSAGRAWRL
ncbi:hypothetical protein J4Q44_G00379480 [Coregonus suidteri]|uniref:Uncharacterized protein n=1 Tax=Coregonus suidteri TaxID=861788 RepID=A0AAN8KIN5_9TELE